MKLDDIHAAFMKHQNVIIPVIYIIVFVVLNIFIPELMGVFDVKMASYINYILFFNAMFIFYLMLPRKDVVF